MSPAAYITILSPGLFSVPPNFKGKKVGDIINNALILRLANETRPYRKNVRKFAINTDPLPVSYTDLHLSVSMSSVTMELYFSYLSIECFFPAVFIQAVPQFKACCPRVDKEVHFPLRCNSCHFFLSSKINLSKTAVSKMLIDCFMENLLSHL